MQGDTKLCMCTWRSLKIPVVTVQHSQLETFVITLQHFNMAVPIVIINNEITKFDTNVKVVFYKRANIIVLLLFSQVWKRLKAQRLQQAFSSSLGDNRWKIHRTLRSRCCSARNFRRATTFQWIFPSRNAEKAEFSRSWSRVSSPRVIVNFARTWYPYLPTSLPAFDGSGFVLSHANSAW